MKRRYRWIDGKIVEVTADTPRTPRGPMVFGDIPEYTSPIDGRPISGRAQRREDLKRNGCRPWEGMEQERKEADRQRGYIAQREEQHLDRAAREVWHQMPPDIRRKLMR